MLSKIEELLDESFCSFLIYSTISHSLSSTPLLMSSTPQQPVGDGAGLASSVWLSIWQRKEGHTQSRNLCLHPNIVIYFFKIMMCEIKICMSKG